MRIALVHAAAHDMDRRFIYLRLTSLLAAREVSGAIAQRERSLMSTIALLLLLLLLLLSK